MSKRVMESISESTEKSRQTVQSYQPVWMAHWMRRKSNSTAGRHDDSASGNKELDHATNVEDLTDGLEATNSAKEPAVVETKTETESRRMISKSFGNEASCSSHMKHGAGTDEIQAVRPTASHNFELAKSIDSKGGIQFSSGVTAAEEASLKKFLSISEGTSKNRLGWVQTSVAKGRSSDTSMPFKEMFVGSHVVPYHYRDKSVFDKGKAVVCPSVSRPTIISNQFPNTKLRIVEQEHHQKHSQPADLICDRKIGGHLESDTSMNELHRTCNTSLLLDAPSMNDYHLPTFGRDWLHSGMSLLPDQSIASEKNEFKMSHYDHYSLNKLPSCARDMETMRICTTVDSVEATPGGHPRFSQTTHSVLITKKTDASMLKEDDMFRKLITKMNGNLSSDHNLPKFFGQANRGVKFQHLSSSSNSEGQRNVRDGGIGTSKVAIKNESSAETDTMDVDFLKEERPKSGANASRSTKGIHSDRGLQGIHTDTGLSPRFDVASSREIGCRWTSTGLPDINLEIPALPAAASSSENAGHSSSRTQSLEMDMLLVQAEQPNQKSEHGFIDSSKADATTRWVKRLKVTSSDSSGHGTKSSNLAESSSHHKRRKFLRSILKNRITSSDPTPRRHHGKEPILSDRSQDLSNEDEHFMLDPEKKSKEFLLSHVWIKRWLCNVSQISPKKSEKLVVCEPQSSKLSLDDLQKKQFPSIAAMALMGKTMNGFQSCELQKRGNFTVWNTKAF